MTNPARLLTIGEAASRLGLKPSTVRKMVLERRIDVIRPGVRAVRIPESAINRIIERGFRPAVIVKEANSCS
jgi:excisionase family DNA binding protein